MKAMAATAAAANRDTRETAWDGAWDSAGARQEAPASPGAEAGRGATRGSADELVRDLQQDLAAEAHARLRERLLRQPIEWLVDELMARLDLDISGAAASAPALPLPAVAERAPEAAAPVRPTLPRATPKRTAPLDESALHAFVAHHHALTRDRLELDGYLLPEATPCQGTQLIGTHCRTPAGERLLHEAKALLDALLFGDESAGVALTRVQRELLTITLARPKADALACLLRAATEIDAEGTWRDPERVSHDSRAPNTVIEVEYGETATELVGRGIALALRLINDLEINEQVLYARMTNIEDSSLANPA